jgi:UDP-N-acetylmuramate--alanine ligase
VLFQPHRYTRTRLLWDEFCRSFHQADVLLLTDIYPAGEQSVHEVSAERLAVALGQRGHRHVRHVGGMKSATEQLVEEAREGDVVLTLGAGNVWHAGETLLERRRTEEAK